jgi:hypothetical protein
MEELTVESLIREGAGLKNQIDALSERLKQVNATLAAAAEFENGKKTAHLVGAGFRVKVQLKENISWSQEKLLKFREYVPEETFASLFKSVYEPASKKAIDGFLGYASKELVEGLQWCRTVKEGQPSVTYEPLEEPEVNCAA